MTTKTITTKDISELRARTGAGIGDCKKALEEAGGDMDAAAELLRKKGTARPTSSPRPRRSRRSASSCWRSPPAPPPGCTGWARTASSSAPR
jgi:hypothetical protein